jgi:hypothetical protein
MNCPSCGTILEAGVATCPKCGMPTPYNAATPLPITPSSEETLTPVFDEDPFTETALESPGSQPGLVSQQVPSGITPPVPPSRQTRSIDDDVHLARNTQPAPSPMPPLLPQQGPQRPRGLSRGSILLLLAVVVLLLEGGGLLYYAKVSHPGELHAVATDTARTLLTGQAQATARVYAQATATAQALARATALAHATATAQEVATATAQQAMYSNATSGSPVLNDPLKNNGANHWTVGTFLNGSCAFTGGALRVSGKASCLAQATNFVNFAYQAQETFMTTAGAGGLMFRVDIANQRAYFFEIRSNGCYTLATLQVNSSGENSLHVLMQGCSPAVNQGVNRSNLLTVVARGSTISLYINGQYVAQVSDSHARSGAIGVFSDSSSPSSEVAFHCAQVWQL